jgi:hypothetical protein
VICVYDDANNTIETQRAQGRVQRLLVAIYVRDARSIIKQQRGDLGRLMPVPPNITQTADDDQHVENHPRYDRE